MPTPKYSKEKSKEIYNLYLSYKDLLESYKTSQNSYWKYIKEIYKNATDMWALDRVQEWHKGLQSIRLKVSEPPYSFSYNDIIWRYMVTYKSITECRSFMAQDMYKLLKFIPRTIIASFSKVFGFSVYYQSSNLDKTHVKIHGEITPNFIQDPQIVPEEKIVHWKDIKEIYGRE